MRIAYFTESLPPLTDGVSHTLSYLKQSLTNEGHDFIFFSPFMPQIDGWRGKTVKIISMPFPLYPKYRISLPAFHDIKSMLDQFKPDILHICSPFFLGLTAYGYGKEKGIPVVNSYHTRFVSYFKYYGFRKMEWFGWRYLRWFYNQAAMNFVPSRATIAELEAKGFNNLSLWERGIDMEKFSSRFVDHELRQKWSPDGSPIVIFVGRIVKEKDIDVLIAAHRILESRNVNFQLVMVGDGPYRREVARNIPGTIFMGFLEGEELSRAYASADIFAFPSTTESFGNVVLEAAASGLPAVVSSEGGVKDVVQDGETGFIARAHDPMDFALKLESLILNDMLRNSISIQSLEYASTKSWQKVNQVIIDEYQSIVEGNLRLGSQTGNEKEEIAAGKLPDSYYNH